MSKGDVTVREPTGAEKELQDRLETMLNPNGNTQYVVVTREPKEGDVNVGTYRLFGNVGDEEGVMVHLLNFVDGMLEDDAFAYFASLVSKRALSRLGVNIPFLGEAKPKAN